MASMANGVVVATRGRSLDVNTRLPIPAVACYVTFGVGLRLAPRLLRARARARVTVWVRARVRARARARARVERHLTSRAALDLP